jgi:hypothetical protein
MLFRIESNHYNGNYYITLWDYKNKTNFINDKNIAKLINISFEKYQKILLNQFNGVYKFDNNIVFNKENDIKQTIEWIESKIIMKKMNKSN